MRDNQIPISVIIPAFNGEKYIGEAIESVLKQTLVPAEIIVINDGSTDNTETIAKNYGVNVISQVNKGISSARNAGIVNSKFDWVALLDQDDIWRKNKIEEQWNIITKYNIDIVFTDTYTICDNEVINKSRLSNVVAYKQIIKQKISNQSYLYDNESLISQIKFANFLSPSTMLANKNTLVLSGLFDENLMRIEDRDLFLRCFDGNVIAIIDQLLVGYRVHGANSSKDDIKMKLGEISLAEKIIVNQNLYPTSVINYYRSILPLQYYYLGCYYLDNNNIFEAKSCFLRSMNHKFKLKTLLRLFQSYVG